MFLLGENALCDVHKHRARELPARIGLRPPLNPDRLAVVLAAQFEYDAAGVRAFANGGERVADAPLGIRCIGHQRYADGANHLVGRDAEDSHCRSIGADKPRLKVFVHIRNRRFLKQIAETLFAFNPTALGPEPFKFGDRTRREYTKNRELPRLGRHRAFVEHSQMAEMLTGFVHERHAEITLNA